MERNEFIEKVSALPGVSKKTAEKLFDAGFTDIEKLKAATAKDLQAVEGVGPKTADAIVAGLADLDLPARKEEIAVVEKGKAAPKTEVVEPAKVYQAKLKPTLDAETKRLLAIRKMKKAKQPYFARYPYWHSKRLEKSGWRSPKGPGTPQRKDYAERPPRVRIGYRKPAATRGLHSSGFEEVPVHNVKDLDKVDPATQAARIGGTVGMRKRKEIIAAANERKIRILNHGKVS